MLLIEFQSAARMLAKIIRKSGLTACLAWAAAAPAAGLTNLFFLHHSTGSGLINGGMRDTVAAYNGAHGTAFAFWDHGYNGAGLTDPSGAALGISYNVPNDNTDPDGLYYLWTSTADDAAACRNRILSNHEVISFKSCYPASDISDADELAQYQAWYLAMRNVFDQFPQRLFVVMSTPPLHRLSTSPTAANYARQFAAWLKSAAYLAGHDNLVCFDLFDYLAGADNMLKYEYEKSHSDGDSHPNTLANQTVGPIFADFLMAAALGYAADTNLAAPRNLTASDGTYGDRVVLAWNAVAQAAHYEVWRNTQNDSGGAAPLAAAVTAASFTDTDVVPDTVYWYWVRAVNDSQTSAFSVPNTGYAAATPPAPRVGPVIRANGATGAVAVASGDALFATVALNAGEYAGIPADWWVVAVPTAGNWFYLNSFLQWMPVAAGDLGACRPAYQGALFDLPEVTALDPVRLPDGIYYLYFAVDTLDGMINYPAGPILLDSVTVTVQ